MTPGMTTPSQAAPKPPPRRQKTIKRRVAGAATGGSPTRAAKAPRASTGAHLRYRFDNTMARGPIVVIAYLALLSLLIVIAAAVISVLAGLVFAGGESTGFFEAVWQAMLRMVDAGTFAAETAWPTRLLAFVVTIGGIFLAGSLIGLIANAVDTKVEELRRGRSPVIESGHTLILGWSPQVPRIISELIIANESEKRAAVVVLSPEDKTVMEEVLGDQLEDRRTTRIVCRNGNPSLPSDLERAGAATARSIIAVRPGSAAPSLGEAEVIKAVLAVRALDPTLERAHVVAELDSGDNTDIIRAIGAGRVLTVSSDRVVAEVTAQACLQAGLAAVFTDLLDFDGDEIYFADVPEVVGRPYAEALIAFDHCSVMGRRTNEGRVDLNPTPETILEAGDQLIVVAEDDSAIRFDRLADVHSIPPSSGPTPPPEPVRITVVGWSGFGAMVLRELDEFIAPGSVVSVVVDQDLVDSERLSALEMHNATVEVSLGSGGAKEIQDLAAAPTPDQVIVLGYRDSLGMDEADARTLLSLLALRQLWPASPGDHVRIIAELLDQRNLVLADPVGIDDLIVSNALSSLLMAQLSEHADLEAVFDDLFDADGAILEVTSASAVTAGGPMTYGSLVAAGGAAGMSVLGYRLASSGDVVLNPRKADRIEIGIEDELIVISGRG